MSSRVKSTPPAGRGYGLPFLDWRFYHAVNVFVAHHSWLGRATSDFEHAMLPIFVVATLGLWLCARPGGARRWKLASASALASAALALVVNRIVAAIWDRPRPFEAHHVTYVYGRSHDPSFPSDHASATFAIAFAVLMFDRLVGSLFLAAAILVAAGRVLIGVHYPGDVLASLLVGLASALVIVRLARPLLSVLVRLVERLTDPVLAPLWRLRARG
jgi:undecaprenyl-diphosphatase